MLRREQAAGNFAIDAGQAAVLEERAAEYDSYFAGARAGTSAKWRSRRRDLPLQLRTLPLIHRNRADDALRSVKRAMQQKVREYFVEQLRFTPNRATEIILMSVNHSRR